MRQLTNWPTFFEFAAGGNRLTCRSFNNLLPNYISCFLKDRTCTSQVYLFISRLRLHGTVTNETYNNDCWISCAPVTPAVQKFNSWWISGMTGILRNFQISFAVFYPINFLRFKIQNLFRSILVVIKKDH